jgi:hypothetical protein
VFIKEGIVSGKEPSGGGGDKERMMGDKGDQRTSYENSIMQPI